jgi:hypothetical protein
MDPLHKWVGTYNVFRIHLLRFFKWLYAPNVEPKLRPKPAVINNIPRLKRKEISIYTPSDLWTQKELQYNFSSVVILYFISSFVSYLIGLPHGPRSWRKRCALMVIFLPYLYSLYGSKFGNSCTIIHLVLSVQLILYLQYPSIFYSIC